MSNVKSTFSSMKCNQLCQSQRDDKNKLQPWCVNKPLSIRRVENEILRICWSVRLYLHSRRWMRLRIRLLSGQNSAFPPSINWWQLDVSLPISSVQVWRVIRGGGARCLRPLVVNKRDKDQWLAWSCGPLNTAFICCFLLTYRQMFEVWL